MHLPEIPNPFNTPPKPMEEERALRKVILDRISDLEDVLLQCYIGYTDNNKYGMQAAFASAHGLLADSDNSEITDKIKQINLVQSAMKKLTPEELEAVKGLFR